MVDFGNTQIEGSIQAGVQRQAPVVDMSGAVLGEALQRPAQTIGGIVGSIFKANQEKEGDAVLNGFRSKLLSLADAAEQNNWSIGEIGVRQRQLYAEALSNAPGYGDDLNDIYTSLTGGRVAGVLAGASEYSQAQTKLMTDAVSNGWVTDQSNPGQGIQNYMANQAATNQLALAVNTRNVTENERKVAITDGLRKVAVTGLPWVQNKVQVALDSIQEGADPAEVYAQLQSDYATQKAYIQEFAQETESEWITTPMDAIIADFGKVVNGEYTTEAYNASTASIIAKGKAAWAADPEIGQILIAQEVLGENFPTLMQQMLPRAQTKLAEFLTKSTEGVKTPAPDVFDLTEGTQQNIELLRSELKAVNAGGVDEAGTTQTNTKMTNFFRSFKNHAGAVDNPQEMRLALEFMATEEFNTWAVANGGVPAGMKDSVETLMETQYTTPLLEAVSARWEGLEFSIPGAGVTPENPYGLMDTHINNFIEPVWDGDGLRFVPKAGYEDNTIIRSAVKGLNVGENSVAAPINTLIKASASAEGSNDYKSIWENEFKERLFPTPATVEEVKISDIPPFTPESQTAVVGSKGNWVATPENAGGVKAATTANREALASVPDPSAITLADFNEDLELIKEVVVTSKAVEPIAMLQSSNPVKIAEAYIGLSEENKDQNTAIASFIKQSAGININPAQTAWCAAFLDGVLHRAGLGGGTGKLNARSYLDWGKPVDVPQVGDVVVLARGPIDGWQGHVGLFMGYEANGDIKILGGNQGNSVSVKGFSSDNLLGYRRAGS